MDTTIFSAEERAALESLRQPFAVYQYINKRVVTLLLSDGFCDLFGYTDRCEAIYDMNNNMYKDTHPDDIARISDAAFRFATEDAKYDVIYRTRKKNTDEYVIVHAAGEHVYTDDGIRLAQVWYTNEGTYTGTSQITGIDIPEELSKALHTHSAEKASQYDFLTGLPNMTSFFELAEAEKSIILQSGGKPVLLYFDFRGMKFFNTKYGFAEGDRMLRHFAGMLKEVFGTANCCRIGADHFSAATELDFLEEKLKSIFRKWEEFCSGKTLHVHVGIYISKGDNIHVNLALDKAKLACNALHESYSSCFNYYTQTLSDDEIQKQYIVENFERAIREKWIRVYLQPIIRTVNERVCDTEALARWIDPEKGLLSPAVFIPALEEAGLIYKLDLYMLDQVLDLIKVQTANGFSIIPHSINLSRSDFDSCDIVEEFRKRVDAAGISRDKITIEITESIIGKDFEFIKDQIERFQKLGFPVWMDDFGSGYSSLDVLQSIKFDLIKFDMSFMRKLDQGDDGKVILTELMRMATSLGVDTVCEGVETESQIRFLREIGCSKLQGYFYGKPIPFETIQEMHRNKTLIKNENPNESDYYESIGRLNLFDLGVIASEDMNAMRNTFSTIPIAILEIKDGKARYLRSNRSYQEYVKRFYNTEILKGQSDFGQSYAGDIKTFLSVVNQCGTNGIRAFFDEKMPDGSVVHSFARRISVNPVTGGVAAAVAVLSVSEPDESTTYADIARSLAADYYNIFVIDLDTNQYIEYSSQVGGEELSIERHGQDFFASARRDTMVRIYEEDREPFLKWFTKENVLREIDKQGVFTTTYRLIDTGTPMYVNMKITRMQDSNRLILGISIIDAQMKQQEEEKKLRQEKIFLGRIAALSPDYIVLYTVDPVTGHYTQFNPSGEFESFGLAMQGDDFFADVIKDAPKAIDPEDLNRHLRVFTKDHMMHDIQKFGFYIHNYRLLLNGKSVPVSLKATLIPEEDGEKILLGVTADDRGNYSRMLEDAYEDARNTGIINTHIAQALARGYTDLYYVNMDSDELIEYHTDDVPGVLTEARRSADFFEGCVRDAKIYIHPDDQAAFTEAMNRDFLKKVLASSNIFEMTYRRLKDGVPVYVKMRVTRIEEDPRFIVISVADIDELMKKRFAEERIQEERIIYARLHAITGNFICVYVVDPNTGSYREFSSTDIYEHNFAQAKEGTDFFGTVRRVACSFNYPEDLDRFLSAFTKDNVMEEVGRSGIFTLGYRLNFDGKPHHVQLKAAMVEEKEGLRLIVGINDIDAQIRQEEELNERLVLAQSQARIDALTKLKNRHSYLDAEVQMDRQIANHQMSPFAIVMLDVNDLKKVNDTSGHQAGDQYLRDACKIICDTFKHSPVFRIGGDEFAVIAQGEDYEKIEERIEEINQNNTRAAKAGGIVIACGMARFENDPCVAVVLKRADQNMYENKTALKAGQPDL